MDEGRFGLKSTYVRAWTRRGVTPRVRVQQGYQNFYAYACAQPKTGAHFLLFLPEVNTEMMSLFLREFAAGREGERILLVLDGAGWHASKGLEIPDNIQLCPLPPYSPELNPVERLWRHFKKEATHNILFDSLDQLMDALQVQVQSLSDGDISRLCACDYM